MSVCSPHLGCPPFVSARAARTWYGREPTYGKRTLPGAEIVQTRPQQNYSKADLFSSSGWSLPMRSRFGRRQGLDRCEAGPSMRSVERGRVDRPVALSACSEARQSEGIRMTAEFNRTPCVVAIQQACLTAGWEWKLTADGRGWYGHPGLANTAAPSEFFDTVAGRATPRT
jgi:hypothetical protein